MTAAHDVPTRDEGFAMYFVMVVMLTVIILSAALVNGGNATVTGVNRDELGTRALQAAEAGLQTAVHRLNLEQPVAAQCITTTVSAPASGGWCSRTAPESIGHSQSFRYQVSIVRSTGCTGASLGTGIVERCIVAFGTAGYETRRVVIRAVASTGANPFPVSGILGLSGITVGNNVTETGSLGSNGQISLGSNSTVTGGVSLWTGAPNPTGYGGPVTRVPTQYVLSPANPVNPATNVDSSTSNDNARLIQGASPADSCSPGNATPWCYVDTVASPRTLTLGSTGSVTLGGSYYNFCQVNMGNGAAINIAANAKVIIFIDSPTRTGSGCTAGQGGLSTGNNAVFGNPAGDPSALFLVVYGNPVAWPTLYFPNNQDIAASIYAPTTIIDFKNNGVFRGGISAYKVNLKNNGLWDSRAAALSLTTTLIYYRGSWRQCPSFDPPLSDATNGCV